MCVRMYVCMYACMYVHAGIRAIFFSVVDGASSLSAILFVTFLALFVFTVVGVEFYMGSFRRYCRMCSLTVECVLLL